MWVGVGEPEREGELAAEKPAKSFEELFAAYRHVQPFGGDLKTFKLCLASLYVTAASKPAIKNGRLDRYVLYQPAYAKQIRAFREQGLLCPSPYMKLLEQYSYTQDETLRWEDVHSVVTKTEEG